MPFFDSLPTSPISHNTSSVWEKLSVDLLEVIAVYSSIAAGDQVGRVYVRVAKQPMELLQICHQNRMFQKAQNRSISSFVIQTYSFIRSILV